jgi:phosphate uptake regulator
METRKVYVSGGSTYVISLPKKWVRKTDLKAGDSLEIMVDYMRMTTMQILQRIYAITKSMLLDLGKALKKGMLELQRMLFAGKGLNQISTI